MSPTTDQWPDPVRKVTVVTAYIGFAIALAGTIVRLIGGSLSVLVELPGAIVLGVVLAVPSALALLGTRDRPLMLLPAGVLGIAGMLGVFSIFGVPLAILGLIWIWAYLRVSVGGQFARKFGMIVVPILWLGAVVTLFAHLDPRCEQTLVDGTVQAADPLVRGMETGWVWEIDTSNFSGGSTAEANVESEVCSSDVVTPIEMVVALAFSALAVGYAWSLAGTTRTVEPETGLASAQPR